MKRYSILAVIVLFVLCFLKPNSSYGEENRIKINQIIENFESVGEWGTTSQFFNKPTISFDCSKEQVHDGSSSGKISYENLALKKEWIAKGRKVGYIGVSLKKEIPGIVTEISLWVYGNEGGEGLLLRIDDAYRETYICSAGKINWQGWKYCTFEITSKAYHYTISSDAIKNDRVDYPLFGNMDILLDGLTEGMSGIVYLDNLTATTLVTPADIE